MALRVVRVLAKLEPGGAQLSALRLSVALRAHGIETRLVVGDACRAGIRLAHEHGFEPECFRSRLSGLQWTPSRAFATWLAPRLGGADLVHAHMFGAWWAAARVVAPGVPLVASEHNALLWPGLSRDSALRAALPRVDHLFAHGPAVRAQLLAAGLPPQRLSPGRSPIAVTSARLAPDKGPDVLAHGRGVLVAPEDPEALAAALADVVSGRRRPDTAGARAYAAPFTPALVSADYAAVYRILLSPELRAA